MRLVRRYGGFGAPWDPSGPAAAGTTCPMAGCRQSTPATESRKACAGCGDMVRCRTGRGGRRRKAIRPVVRFVAARRGERASCARRRSSRRHCAFDAGRYRSALRQAQRIFVVRDGREYGTDTSASLGARPFVLDAVERGTRRTTVSWRVPGNFDRSAAPSVFGGGSLHLPKARQIFLLTRYCCLSAGGCTRILSPVLQAARHPSSRITRRISLSPQEPNWGAPSGFSARRSRFRRHLERGSIRTCACSDGRHAQAADELRAALREGVAGEFLYLRSVFSAARKKSWAKHCSTRPFRTCRVAITLGSIARWH